MNSRHAGYGIAAAGALLVAALTLTPTGAERLPIACLWCDQRALQDVILNVLLFIPLGIGLGVARIRVAVAVLAVLALTLGVEGSQLWLVGGRDPSPRDVAANAAGGLAGYFIGIRWALVLLPHKRTAWRLAGWSRLVWVAVNLVAGWLLVPSLPARPQSFIAGTHVGGFADFAGRVVQSGVMTEPPASTAAMPASERPLAAVSALIQPGPRRDELTPVVTAVEGTGDFPLMLAVEGDDLVLHVRTRADAARLRSPSFRFPDEIKPWYRTAAPPRNVLSVVAVRTAAKATAAVQSSTGGLLRAEVPVRTTQAWAMLWPAAGDIEPGLDLASGTWCLLLVLPIGYWTARTGRHRRRMGWSLAAVATGSGFIIGPLLFQQAWPGLADLGGALVGLAAGGLLGHASRSALPRAHIHPSTRT